MSENLEPCGPVGPVPPNSRLSSLLWPSVQSGGVVVGGGSSGAATDCVRNVPDQIRPWLTQHYICRGTDGFGRSDARAELRRHFEVDRNFITLDALNA